MNSFIVVVFPYPAGAVTRISFLSLFVFSSSIRELRLTILTGALGGVILDCIINSFKTGYKYLLKCKYNNPLIQKISYSIISNY